MAFTEEQRQVLKAKAQASPGQDAGQKNEANYMQTTSPVFGAPIRRPTGDPWALYLVRTEGSVASFGSASSGPCIRCRHSN
jgi:hypothetical protein